MIKPRYSGITLGYLLIIISVWFFGYFYGKSVGEAKPKVCSKVLGMQPVSSTGEECIYILGTQGKAYWKQLAVKEEKK